jgi:hypothetical protein
VATIFRRTYNDGDFIGIRFIDSMTSKDVTLSVRAKFTIKKDNICATSKDACVYLEDTLVVQTKIVNRRTARLPFKTNEWEVLVAQGMDLSLVCMPNTDETRSNADTDRRRRSQCTLQSYFLRSQ